MRIAVCDDVRGFRNQVKKLIHSYNDKYVVVEYSDGNELVQTKEPFDLIFLDTILGGYPI